MSRAARGTDPDAPVTDAGTLAQVVNAAVAGQRFTVWLFSIFGGVALFLAVAGIYGVLSYAVSRRTREIGIRMALGARRISVATLIVARGLRLLAVGGSLGIVGALAVTRVVESLLFETSTTDPATFVIASAVLTTAVLLATLLPARRASGMHPMGILRDD